jgi:hypothetical protein
VKDNEIRDFVSALTKVAEEYGQTQQLRERIRGIVFPFIEEARRTVSGQEAVYQVRSGYGWIDVSEGEYANGYQDSERRIVYAAPIPATEPK